MFDQLKKSFFFSQFDFPASLDEVKMLTENYRQRNFRLEWTSQNSFWVSSNLIFGFTKIQSPIEGICTISPNSYGYSKIKVEILLHVELVMTSLVCTLFPTYLAFQEESIPIWVYLIFLVVLIISWIFYLREMYILRKRINKYFSEIRAAHKRGMKKPDFKSISQIFLPPQGLKI